MKSSSGVSKTCSGLPTNSKFTSDEFWSLRGRFNFSAKNEVRQDVRKTGKPLLRIDGKKGVAEKHSGKMFSGCVCEVFLGLPEIPFCFGTLWPKTTHQNPLIPALSGSWHGRGFSRKSTAIQLGILQMFGLSVLHSKCPISGDPQNPRKGKHLAQILENRI